MNIRAEDSGSPPQARNRGPRLLLHVEGATLFLAATVLFFGAAGSWILFILLLLVPDISMIGYLRNARLGALTYNAFHAYPLPVLLVALGYWTGSALLLQVALVWLAHIGMDRMFGYGLKYPTGFKDTHLQRL